MKKQQLTCDNFLKYSRDTGELIAMFLAFLSVFISLTLITMGLKKKSYSIKDTTEMDEESTVTEVSGSTLIWIGVLILIFSALRLWLTLKFPVIAASGGIHWTGRVFF